MNKDKRQPIFVRYNGLGTVAGVLVVVASVAWIFSVVNALAGSPFTGEDSLFSIIMTASSGTPIILFIGMFYGWSSKGSSILSDLVLAKDFKYLGLESGEGGKRRFFKNESLGRKNKPILRWLAYSHTWDGKSNQFKLDTDSGFLTLRPSGHRHTAEQITSILKVEKRLIRKLQKNKVYDKNIFKSGLPLASYLLLCDKYEDSEARAIIYKNLNLAAIQVYLLNQISTDAEDIENFVELPFAWLLEATGVQLKWFEEKTPMFP